MGPTQQNLHQQARQLFDSNMLEDALNAYNQICLRHPEDTQAWHMGSAILGILGKYDEAIEYCKKVISLSPKAHEPYLNLANIYMANNRFSDAKSNFNKALKRKPDDVHILTNFGGLYIKLNNTDKAIRYLKIALRYNANNHEALNNLGVAYRMTNTFDKARECFTTAINQQPGFIDAYNNLAGIYTDQLMFNKAETLYQKALQIDPNNIDTLCNLGKLQQTTGNYDSAKRIYEKILSVTPNNIGAISALASLNERQGNNADARQILTPLIRHGKYDADTLITYSLLCRKSGLHNEAIHLITTMLGQQISQHDKINLLFSLGELHEDLENYDKAFKYFHEANILDKQGNTIDCGEQYFETMMSCFNTQTLPQLTKSDNNSSTPIFIVGMPRSGTSLVEQILASHPDVMAGDERDDITDIIDGIKHSFPDLPKYPEFFTSIGTPQLNTIADSYIQMIEDIAQENLRFTDKAPLNGMHLGLINQLLPSSHVIICNRNPIDTCLSIYFHRFNNAQAYSKDLSALGQFYCNYSLLLQHWVNTLNIKIHEIQYEDLVENPEPTIRDLIKSCDLKWDDKCLSFHTNKRTMNTPSYDEVRKPIYTSSVSRWKHYKEHLQPLITSLKACKEIHQRITGIK